jgi:flagellar biosynthesis/type III secretory pathway protein FliH
MEQLEAAVREARRQGEEDGFHSGLEQARSQADAAAAILEEGVNRAAKDLNDALAGLERLAPLLALIAVERVLGEGANQKDLVGQIVDQQLRTLDQQAILRITVSAHDFKPHDLDHLKKRFGNRPVETRLEPALESGGCRLTLRLGELEIGPRQQWAQVAQTLFNLSVPLNEQGAAV